MGICNMTQGTQSGALQQPRGEGGGWEVQEFQEGEDIKKKKERLALAGFLTPCLIVYNPN